MYALYFLVCVFNIIVLFLIVNNAIGILKDHRYFSTLDIVGICTMYVGLLANMILASLYIFTI